MPDLRELRFCRRAAIPWMRIALWRYVRASRPWVDREIDYFGQESMLWGSDWPVVNLGSGLPLWINMTRDLVVR